MRWRQFLEGVIVLFAIFVMAMSLLWQSDFQAVVQPSSDPDAAASVSRPGVLP
jgi:hypothetical protein